MKHGHVHMNLNLKDNQVNGDQGSPWGYKVQQNSSPMKVMVILAYDCQGVLVCHPVREGLTVNATYYSSFLVCQLRRAVRSKSPELLKPLRGKRFANKHDILTAFQREVSHVSDTHAPPLATNSGNLG